MGIISGSSGLGKANQLSYGTNRATDYIRWHAPPIDAETMRRRGQVFIVNRNSDHERPFGAEFFDCVLTSSTLQGMDHNTIPRRRPAYFDRKISYTAQISVMLPADQRTAIDDLVNESGQSIGHVVRGLLTEGLLRVSEQA